MSPAFSPARAGGHPLYPRSAVGAGDRQVVVHQHRPVCDRNDADRVDADGEHWTGRDLMPVMGYDNWRRFEDAIERARRSAQNVGANVARHFSKIVDVDGADKINDQGYRQRDYRLTRYAAYLIAMNGDPRKSEVAAAQTYFATKTREAETAPERAPALPDLSTCEGQLSVIDMLRDQVEARHRAELEAAGLRPDAAAWRVLGSTDGDYSVRDAGYILNRDPAIDTGQKRLFHLLREWRLIDRNNRPYAEHAAHVTLRPQSFKDPETGEQRQADPQVRITYAGLKYLHRRMGGVAPLDLEGHEQPELPPGGTA